jgi:hypothetical protein
MNNQLIANADKFHRGNGLGIKTSLRDKTLEMLQNRSVKLTFTQISKETGLNETWIGAFHQNRVPNPGVNFVQTLYEYLSKRQLDI